MKNTIKRRLDNYLEFNSDELFSFTDYIEIFGGAIRDSIANLKIHDIDILCMSISAKKAAYILENHGYTNVTNKLSTKDVQQMYKETHIVFEPWTFMNSNLKIVQLIRPYSEQRGVMGNIGGFNSTFDFNAHKKSYYDIMREVDISCCGVSWDGEKLTERYEDAINHCRQKVYTVNKNAKMYNDRRINDRKWKLESRGWKCIDDMSEKEYQTYLRSKKLERIV